MRRNQRSYVLGDVILKVDNKAVNNYNDIYHALDNKKIGDTVNIQLLAGR